MDRLSSPLLEKLARARRILGHERRSAPALVAELLAEPPAIRLSRVELESELHTWGVAELLYRRSGELEAADPAESGRLARLVLAVAGRLAPTLHPSAVVADLQARAWAGFGESERRQGRLREAEAALRQAAANLSAGSGDLLVEARLLEFEAALRGDQGRRSEAGALLKQAAARYLAAREPEPLARVLQKRDRLRQAPGPEAVPLHMAFEPVG